MSEQHAGPDGGAVHTPDEYSQAVDATNYAEFAHCTECDYKTMVQSMADHPEEISRYIELVLRSSVASGNNANTLKRIIFYGTTFDIGQVAWLLEHFREHDIQINPEAIERLKNPLLHHLLHAGFGMQTEAAEFNLMLSEHIFDGKPLDTVNIREELGDVTWFVGIACKALDVSLLAVLRKNIAKLYGRFKDKFCYVKNLNRDLAKERGILEGS